MPHCSDFPGNDIEVRTDAGEHVISNSINVDYEYFAIVQAAFREDRPTVERCAQGEGIRTKIHSCETGERLSRNARMSGFKVLAKNVPKLNWVLLRVCDTGFFNDFGYRALVSKTTVLSGQPESGHSSIDDERQQSPLTD